MNPQVQELIGLLQVEQLEQNLFRGISGDIGSPRVFGGQVLGQALMAAALTVEGSRTVHSLHAYFLRPGDKHARIVYDVDRIRDGGSFTTRRVVAIQHGQPIFNFAASFHVPEDGPSHRAGMPQVPGPEGLTSDLELRRQHIHKLPERLRAVLHAETAIEIRQVVPLDPFDPPVAPPRNDAWFRAVDRLPDDPVLHQAMLAYSSDFGLLRSALMPHGMSFMKGNLQVVSLDHAMWFHEPFRMDEWMLYTTDSPFAGNARGFCRGSIFTQDGRLIASVAQEGLMRATPLPGSSLQP
ncbi:acyl-CoA thioesterase II [Rhizobacter sp. Root1221]|uniref:acyl-CoA thioesterase n=1 Tax=Rhizobacter sp. Root1221 TaxID=1736433 RepID=UPI0006F8B124|nr:acyl-CoA thioesterase II [Rhizobacter sp. Root1221]KQV82932.1 acyl-CoA thioesterase II [Rhizobacter sp. Root1221]